jgi:hypothetical protein
VPIPAGLTRIVISGTAYGGEIWETGFWMNTGPIANESALNSLVVAVAALMGSEATSGGITSVLQAQASSTTIWSSVRGYYYNGIVDTATFVAEYVLATPRAGNGAGNVQPNQLCLVASLRTGFSGRRNRGRMYLPATSPNYVSGAPQISLAGVTATANSIAQAFSAINASVYGKVVVFSQAAESAREVATVIVNSKLDIQRRRANKEAILNSFSSAVTA